MYSELAHLTVEEHDELIKYMDSRADLRRHAKGEEHPRYRVPRMKAIWPAQHATCSICTELMYAYDGGQLKCSNTFATGSSQCWNHVQVDGERIRTAFVTWLWEQLEALPEARQAFFDACWETIHQRTTASGREVAMAEKEIHGLEQQADRLAAAIAEGGEIAALLRRLAVVEDALKLARDRLDLLRIQNARNKLPANRTAFANDALPALLELSRTSYEFADLVKRVVMAVSVIPVQDLQHGQVRPRVRITVQFALDGQPDGSADPTGDRSCHQLLPMVRSLPALVSILRRTPVMNLWIPRGR